MDRGERRGDALEQRGRLGNAPRGENLLWIGAARERLDDGPAQSEDRVIGAVRYDRRHRNPGLGGRPEQRRLRDRIAAQRAATVDLQDELPV